jgi:hypothetical protein
MENKKPFSFNTEDFHSGHNLSLCSDSQQIFCGMIFKIAKKPIDKSKARGY